MATNDVIFIADDIISFEENRIDSDIDKRIDDFINDILNSEENTDLYKLKLLNKIAKAVAQKISLISFKCLICGDSFLNAIELEQHTALFHNYTIINADSSDSDDDESDDNYESDLIVTNIDQQMMNYFNNIQNPNSCPSCSQNFNDQYELGEHFTLIHDSYQDLVILDNNTTGGFPGFDILFMIDMIDYVTNKKLHKLANEHAFCPICLYTYEIEYLNNLTKSCILNKKIKLDDSCYSDSEVQINKKKIMITLLN